MAKYGLFTVSLGDDATPTVTFDGDYMILNQNSVAQVLKRNPSGPDRLVAAVHLEVGQYVREM